MPSTSSVMIFTSPHLLPLQAQLCEALSALGLSPETIRDDEALEPEVVMKFIEDQKTSLPCMTTIQWLAFMSTIRRLAYTRAGGFCSGMRTASCSGRGFAFIGATCAT
jgi:hypothetical protein